MKKAMLDSIKSVSPKVSSSGLPKLDSYSSNRVFFCPEESQFYSQCLEKMVFHPSQSFTEIVEFGTGDGSPVIGALLKTDFLGVVHGYELNATACEVARKQTERYHITERYQIHNQCFFEGYSSLGATCLIANPPYIPAPDDRIYMPALHGGVDGATLTNKLLTLGCDTAMLMVSAYSNPVETIQHAIAMGYSVSDFMITPLQFGYYSSEPKVRDWITELRKQNKAFYSANIYFLAGVLFQKRSRETVDLSTELIKVFTAL
jgi:methylase of polypeptide subunit release factors